VLLRFVISDRDERTGQPMGLMTLAYRLLRSNSLTHAEDLQFREIVGWLESNLPIPARFARKRNMSHKHTHGVSWIRVSAIEVLTHLHALADLVRLQGYVIEILQTERPGYVVYEDQWQVVAEPFHGE
jgi:hypothetical protein